jgi:hypothetical protein
MKIISNFKDYYDGVAINGIDMERVYKRVTEPVKLTDSQYKNWHYDIIGFCGKLYFFNHALEEELIGKYKPEQVKYLTLYGDERIKYDFEEIKDEQSETGKKKIRVEKKQGNNRWVPNSNTENDLEHNPFLLSLFVKYKTPVFRLKPYVWRNENFIITNPCLKDLGFYKVIAPDNAFQQIEQFIGNQLAQESQGQVPVGSDEVIGRSKGFDIYSFRNAKKKPKIWFYNVLCG